MQKSFGRLTGADSLDARPKPDRLYDLRLFASSSAGLSAAVKFVLLSLERRSARHRNAGAIDLLDCATLFPRSVAISAGHSSACKFEHSSPRPFTRGGSALRRSDARVELTGELMNFELPFEEEATVAAGVDSTTGTTCPRYFVRDGMEARRGQRQGTPSCSPPIGSVSAFVVIFEVMRRGWPGLWRVVGILQLSEIAY